MIEGDIGFPLEAPNEKFCATEAAEEVRGETEPPETAWWECCKAAMWPVEYIEAGEADMNWVAAIAGEAP